MSPLLKHHSLLFVKSDRQKEASMSYHEQKSVISIISTVLIFVFYALYVLQKYPEKFPPSAADPGFWGAVILVLIPISA